MGTQGAGRKRSTNKDRTTAEDDALNLIAREAEARLAAKRAARAEAREIRMKELERQQKELSDEDERMSVGSRGSVRVEDGNYLEKGSRAASALTATTLTSLGGTSSRRGSGETALTIDAETSIREIKEIHELKDQIQDVESKYNQNLKEAKDKLVEVEEKYRKAMVSNAQLDNEKNNLMYQVDTLKDSLMELEEQLTESRREYEDKVKEFEREKHAHTVLQFQFNELKETLKQSEELLNEIRQLRLKEEGFHREISDLQETVDWKDKKISALERQKEYTDAIRIERDELREEVVTLKDILKKHGIVLGPDLNINGSVTETVNTEEPSADPSNPSVQETPISPTDGNNSMLGNTEEETNNQKEESDPEQNQDMHDGIEKEHLEDHSNESNESKVEICGSEDQPIFRIEQLDVMKTDQVDAGTSFEKNVVEVKPIEQNISDHQELEATQDTENIVSQQTSEVYLEEQPGKEDDSTQMINLGMLPSNSASEEVALAKEDVNDKSIVVASNIEDLETVDGDSEGVSSKSQANSAGGKKKKRKKRGKKKGPVSEHKNEQGKEKVIAEEHSKGGLQANEGNFTDHHSDNIQQDMQLELVEASQETVDTSEPTVKETGPVSKIENGAQTTSLMDENVELKDTVAFAEVITNSLETTETAIDSTHIDLEDTDLANGKNVLCLDNGNQGVPSKVGSEMYDEHTSNIITIEHGTNVDQMDSSDNTEHVDIAVEDNQKSSDVTAISVVAQQNIDAFLTSIPQQSSSDLNVQDNGIERSLFNDKESELVNCENNDLVLEEICNSVVESVILNTDQCPKSQNEDSADETITDNAATVLATDTTMVKDMCDVTNDGTIDEVGTESEITAITDAKEVKLSPNEHDEMSNPVELLSECSNDSEEVKEALASDCVEQILEVGTDVLVQEDLAKKQSVNDTPEVSEQNCENGDEELDVVDAGIEGRVHFDAESSAKGPNDCNVENIGILSVLESREDEVEVGIDVLEDDISEDMPNIDDSEVISQNIENDTEMAKSFVDVDVFVEENKTDSSETQVLNIMKNGHEEMDTIAVKTEGNECGACQDTEPVLSVEVEAKPSDEMGLEVLAEDINSEDQSLETHALNQEENGTVQEDILNTGSPNAVELVKDDPEIKATPSDDKIEIGVDGEILEENLKEASFDSNSESQKSQNTQNNLEDLCVEPHPIQNDEACHDVVLPRQSMDTKHDLSHTVARASEEEDEGEGLSFDFDDLEMEAAIALSADIKAAEEEVELGVEVLAEEGKDDLVDKEQVECQDVDNECKEQDKISQAVESSTQNDDSDSLEGASLAEKSETSQDQIGASTEHMHFFPNSTQDSTVNVQPSRNDKCKNEQSGEIRQEIGKRSGPAPSGKEAKKSNKKGKGKGKDECKMT